MIGSQLYQVCLSYQVALFNTPFLDQKDPISCSFTSNSILVVEILMLANLFEGWTLFEHTFWA